MKALPLILIAGWGHTGQAMLRLKEALDGYPIQVTSTGELWQTQSQLRNFPPSADNPGSRARSPRRSLPPSRRGKAPLRRDDGRRSLGEGVDSSGGHGVTAAATCSNSGLSRYAAGLREFLAIHRLTDGRVGVIGWSMGGIVALETAREYPGLLQRLVVISGTARFSAGNDEFPGVSASILRAMALGLRRTPDKVLAAYYDKVHAPQSDPLAAAASRNMAIAQLDCSELLQGLEYLQRMDLRNGLDKQTVPTLVVHGREDRIVPWQAGEWLSRRLACSHWRCHEGLGHALPIQSAALLAADIRAFLA